MKHLYLLSGLGVDERVFQYLDLSEHHITNIQWIPHQKGESIKTYAKKLTAQITTQKPILIGLSFGGMVAIEIGKLIETEKIILISSIKERKELPLYFKLSAMIKLHHLIPAQLLKKPNAALYWFFGVYAQREKHLLNDILLETDPHFLKWAIDQILRWDNTVIPQNLQHIHGTSDRIMPHRFINKKIEIKNGGHFMTITKADEVTAILKELLSDKS